MVNYSLTKNTMKPDSGEYIAVVNNKETVVLNDIIDLMVAEGTGLTRPQAMAYFEKFVQSIEYFIQDRNVSITTPLFRMHVTISGVFHNKLDKFDPLRHQINIRLTPGPNMKQLESKLKVKKTDLPVQTPLPRVFTDAASQTKNECITPSNIAMIKGYKLKFDPDDLLQGVFFIPENDPKAEYRASIYSVIINSEIHFQIPQLQRGKYNIVVKAIMKNHKSIRNGKLHELLVVL